MCVACCEFVSLRVCALCVYVQMSTYSEVYVVYIPPKHITTPTPTQTPTPTPTPTPTKRERPTNTHTYPQCHDAQPCQPYNRSALVHVMSHPFAHHHHQTPGFVCVCVLFVCVVSGCAAHNSVCFTYLQSYVQNNEIHTASHTQSHTTYPTTHHTPSYTHNYTHTAIGSILTVATLSDRASTD